MPSVASTPASQASKPLRELALNYAADEVLFVDKSSRSCNPVAF
jgi:hypothetical protein